MKRFFNIFIVIALALTASSLASAEEYSWKAKWISKEPCSFETNTWIAFRTHADIADVPSTVTARIAADTKYWLWINGKMVVREGGLKRGPSMGDGYYDKVEIAPYLQKGDNLISVLVWYFGRAGFSHMSSGIAALLFEAEGDGVEILSSGRWEAVTLPSFTTASGPHPNYRLPESNVCFDARKYPADWYLGENPKNMGAALELGIAPGQAPLGKLVERPIPQWKDYGLNEYVDTRRSGDTLYCRLPYNCQVMPYFKIDAPEGKLVRFETDHRIMPPNEECVRGEYITKAGVQEYESFAWMNGEEVRYIVPSDVKVLEVKYRETGYDTEFAGSFECDDEFLNEYWKKAQRTLYVNMRDTYSDCPDRERAQWWGDEVNDLGIAFYALSRSSDLLARKGILELAAWQKQSGELYAPIPCSNYFKELPMQILASVGWYGFHNFYFYSGDSSFVSKVYGPVHRYLHEVWNLDSDGLPIYRTGDWDWPDAGKHQDRYGQLPLWYYLALKGELCFANMLGKSSDAAEISAMMKNIAQKFNEKFWNGTEYRSPQNTDVPDDRVQALAVVSGIAGPEKYEAIKKVFSERYYSTTYMFRYVLEALFIMDEPSLALDRMKKMYPTIMKDDCSTLYEHWNFSGTNNHAWTGSGVILLGGKVAGIEPTAPGFRRFRVAPQMGWLKHVSCTVPTNYGSIQVTLDRKGKRINAMITVPEGTTCEVPVSGGKTKILPAGEHKVKI
jgi:alpha-L-rhamnosidase